MIRDIYDAFHRNEDRGRFGDNESERVRGNDSVRSDLVEIVVLLRMEKPLAIAVSETDGVKWRWLPKSQIEYEPIGKGFVKVTLPQWLAQQKELI